MEEKKNDKMNENSNDTLAQEFCSNNVNLDVLRQNSNLSSPMSKNYNYRKEVKKLDYVGLKKDLFKLMTDCKKWWPADYGNYGPLFIRMSWHSAGTYRIGDGRGGANRGIQRFTPTNSWPDNVNLDKARRLLWPIKQKYGDCISWADLLVLAGNCALEFMGVPTIGFALGREDVWEKQKDIYWGSGMELSSNMKPDDNLENPLAAVQMGLIYVNPEGPDGVPDPKLSAKDVRETFTRMGMNDEETVALVAGGHTFGKCHGAASSKYLGPSPEAAPLEEMGLGWKNSYKTGNSINTITSGIEGAWKPNPTTWDMGYLTTLFKYQWELIKSPAGAFQWVAKDVEDDDLVMDAMTKVKEHKPIMTTADLSLLYDSKYKEIAYFYLKNPLKFQEAFVNAWFKLIHRDMGPRTRYLGPDIPKEIFIWQDPIPLSKNTVLSQTSIMELKTMINHSNLTISQMVKTAWASASTFRGSDYRGGANGARIQLLPQINWEVNEPIKLNVVLNEYRRIQFQFNNFHNNMFVSLADLIVLGGCVGIELATRRSSYNVIVPFISGRCDARQEQTDINSFEVLEPKADGFRNYVKAGFENKTEDMIIDKAQLLNLSPSELTALIGGLRVLNINYKECQDGVLTLRKETLTNDYFVNLLDQSITWTPIDEKKSRFIGTDSFTGKVKWTASRVDLLFGSNAELRAIAEVYASNGNEYKFIQDFINVFVKVMNADRFDIEQ